MDLLSCTCDNSQVEMHETIDNRHFCSCVSCGKEITVNVSSFRFTRDNRDYYFFPLLNAHYSFKNSSSSMPDRLCVDRLDFLKGGGIAKKSKMETDPRNLELVIKSIRFLETI